MSEKFIVNSCCCGCTLKTGSLIIGILYLIGSLVGTIQYGYAAVSTHHGILWFSAVVYIIQLIAACLLIHGTRTDSGSLVGLWVYVQGALALMQLVLMVLVFVLGMLVSQFVTYLVSFALCIYCIVVVRSFARQLESEGDSKPSPA